jgi:hypothetical protein
MTTIISAPTTVTVGVSGNQTLASLAASMAPGTWAELTSASSQNAVLGVGPTSGSTIHYCNSMPWNSRNKTIEIVAMDHAAGMQRYMRYDDASNAFVLVMADDGAGAATRHGYDHNAVNPYTGDVYHRLGEYGYEGPGLLVRKFAFGGSSFTNMARVTTLFYMQIAIGATWWSGAFAGAGVQGCLLLYNSGDSQIGGSAADGGMYAYDPLADSWFWKSLGMSPYYGAAGYSYNSVLEYSATHNCAVYGGGGDGPRKLWRLNANRSVTPMPDAPASTTVGIQSGNFVADPVTGNFLLLSAGELWELNPTGSGTWTKQTGARVPPARVGVPGGPGVTFIEGVISSAIPEYGIVAYIKQTGVNYGTFFVYKHA